MKHLLCWHTFAFALTTNKEGLQRELDKIEESIKGIEDLARSAKTRLFDLIDKSEASSDDLVKYEEFIYLQGQTLLRLKYSVINISIQHCLKTLRYIMFNNKQINLESTIKGDLVNLYNHAVETQIHIEDSYVNHSVTELLTELQALFALLPNTQGMTWHHK